MFLDMNDDSPTPPPGEAPHEAEMRELARRTIARDQVEFHTVISSAQLGDFDARLNDISPYGCQSRARGHMLERGASIAIMLPLIGVVEAHVMWGLKGLFGCKFDSPIDPDLYRDLLTFIRDADESWTGKAPPAA